MLFLIPGEPAGVKEGVTLPERRHGPHVPDVRVQEHPQDATPLLLPWNRDGMIGPQGTLQFKHFVFPRKRTT